MPEYLTPGVYLEETSYRGKPIEGVSTSTAGMVGRAQKGREGVPTLVTSFTQFVRDFGEPINSPTAPGDFLGHAVRAFFDNGGARTYVVRVLGAGAQAADTDDASTTNKGQGIVARLSSNTTVLAGGTVLRLESLRGMEVGTEVLVFTRASASAAPFEVESVGGAGDGYQVTAYDPLAGTITLDEGVTETLDPNYTYVHVKGSTPTTTNALFPQFTAVSRGVAGDALAIRFTSVDRPPIAVATAVSAGDAAAEDELELANTGGLYTGALVEVDNGTNKRLHTLTAVDHETRTVTLAAPVGIPLTLPAAPADPTPYVRVLEFKIEVQEGGETVEVFDNCSYNPDPALESTTRYYVDRINDPDTGSRYVSIAAPANPITQQLAHQPNAVDGQPVPLGGGSDGAAPTDPDLIGTDGGPGARTGIQALGERLDVSIVAVPGVTSEPVQNALITHCELLRYRVAVLDAPRSATTTNELLAHRNAYDTSHAAYYAPWLETLELSTGRTIAVPPSGHVMGIYARTDNTRGVHKAPANEVVRNITGLELNFTDGEQDVLNPNGVNLIREFPGRGIRVWGARTLSSDSEWKYLNVRRLFCYLEASIDRGTQWVVFEPNGDPLWDRVSRTITSFMFGVWSSGALLGTTPEKAFFVRCDRSTMTQDDIDNGRLICLIGLAPMKPAEFVIFRIGQFTANES